MRVFSVGYVGIGSVKWSHLGVVGTLLGKEMGKDFSRSSGPVPDALASEFFVRKTANPWALRRGFADTLTACALAAPHELCQPTCFPPSEAPETSPPLSQVMDSGVTWQASVRNVMKNQLSLVYELHRGSPGNSDSLSGFAPRHRPTSQDQHSLLGASR